MHRKIILFAAFMCLIATGNAVSKDEQYAGIKQPKSHKELLQNIKHMMDRHLLLRNDFYVPEKFQLIFGGTNAQWEWVNKSVQKTNKLKMPAEVWCGGPFQKKADGSYTIYGHAEIAAYATTGKWGGENLVGDIQFSFSRTLYEDVSYCGETYAFSGRATVNLTAYFRDGGGLTAKEVKNIFGGQWLDTRASASSNLSEINSYATQLISEPGACRSIALYFNVKDELVKIILTDDNACGYFEKSRRTPTSGR